LICFFFFFAAGGERLVLRRLPHAGRVQQLHGHAGQAVPRPRHPDCTSTLSPPCHW
jgi:hypothetical protein